MELLQELGFGLVFFLVGFEVSRRIFTKKHRHDWYVGGSDKLKLDGSVKTDDGHYWVGGTGMLIHYYCADEGCDAYKSLISAQQYPKK